MQDLCLEPHPGRLAFSNNEVDQLTHRGVGRDRAAVATALGYGVTGRWRCSVCSPSGM